MVVDPDLVMPDHSKSILDGGIEAWARSGAMSPWYLSQLMSLAEAAGFDPSIPIKDMGRDDVNIILLGTKGKRIEITH